MTKHSSLRSLLARRMALAAAAAFGIFALITLIYLSGDLFPESGDDGFTATDAVFTLTGLSISLFASAAIGTALARRLISPLQELGSAADAIARGDFRVRVAPSTNGLGELGELVNDFNTMAALLERAQIDLAYQNSAIAHELRTPLTILKGRLLGLVDGVFEPSPQLHSSLVGHVDDLIRIVDDLRTLALFSAGRLELNLERFELTVEINALIAGLDAELAHAGMRVVLDLEPISVRADRVRVRQILLALVDNACRYAPRSTLTITARTAEDMVAICVADDGPGLPDADLDRVFERFWRADDSRSRPNGGSGLGLSVVKAVAEAHGGSVSVTRMGQRGLGFNVLFPTNQVESLPRRELHVTPPAP